MDDFRKECQDKLRGAADPVATINELVGISLQDIPKAQIGTLAEQMLTLFSVSFQSIACPSPELVSALKIVHEQIETTLNYMEYILAAQAQFPGMPTNSPDDAFWL